jgi:prevent-host-death family protein
MTIRQADLYVIILYIMMSYMKTVTFSDLRNNAKKYFDAVEHGESLEVYRNGKPVAVVSPVRDRSLTRWRTANPIKITGASLSSAILADRAEGD